MPNVLIFGAGGFIGGHFARSLLRRGNVAVTGFGRRRPKNSVIEDFVEGEFGEMELIAKLLPGKDAVYHFISQTIPSTSWEAPVDEIEQNLLPTVRLIEAAATAGVKKFYFASSGGTVYGLNDGLLGEDQPTDPFSPYGIAKRAVESFLLYSNIRHGMSYEIYRISNVFGEGQETAKGLGFINTVLENIVAGRETVIYGDGENIRDYIYIADLITLLEARLIAGFDTCETFNISSNRPITLNCLIELIRDVTGTEFKIRRIPKRPNDNRAVRIDNSKIMSAYPGIELLPLQEGILRTYESLKSRYSDEK